MQQELDVGSLELPVELAHGLDGEVAIRTDTLAERDVDVDAQVRRACGHAHAIYLMRPGRAAAKSRGRMFHRLALLLSILALTSCALSTGPDRELTTHRENLLRTTLKNGLKVLLVEDHAAPVVALNVWVRVGSADEKPDEGGMAHVFEHMLFKGTERRAVGEIARTVEAAGGHINAFTGFDMTVYHITMASRDMTVGIDVLADAVLHSTFDPGELAKEQEVILEEIRRGLDSPHRVLSQSVFDTAYQQHPYRLPVIGTEELVKSFSREQLLDFFERWYVPNNMTFVAVGDLNPKATLKQIREAFSDVEPRPDLSHPRQAESQQSTPRSIVVRRSFKQTLLGLAYPITAFSDPDTPYLDLLSMVLGSGDSSRLYRNVKDRLDYVYTISTSAYTPLDPGLFFVDATVETERIEDAIGSISSELQRMRAFGPSEVELERARVNLLANQVYEKETMQGQARKIGYYESLGGGVEAEAAYLEKVKRATPEDLQRMAQKYLQPEHVNIAVLLPEDERPDLQAASLLTALTAVGDGGRKLVGTPIRDGISGYVLPNGLRVIVKPNHSIPLVAMRLSFNGGQLGETEETQGLTSFLAEMLERGTQQRSAAQLAAEVEGIAGSLGGFSGRNSFGLTAEFLTDSLDIGLDLFADVLLHPAFPPDEIEKVRTERLAALKRREDRLSLQAFELFAKELFIGHPYRFPLIGNEASLERLEREELARYYATYAQPTNGVLSIVGDVEPDAIVEAFASKLSDWQGPEKVELPARKLPPEPQGPREVSLEKNKSQVHILLGFAGLALDDPDLAALDVLTQILSGQGGRLFLELRDRKSLAYSVSAFSIEGIDTGSFGVYIASAPEKLEEAIEGLRRELRRILEEPITAEEVERAKGFLIGTQAVSLQPYGTQASLLSLEELYGLGAAHYLDYEKRIQAVTLDDLQRVAERVIRLDRPLIAIVK
ncbi:MAG: insulinase family protein [Deltaproteobacteria bacterium]|nr:MAG: insulinase family protein [Deltaproteobacteria bacterium]